MDGLNGFQIDLLVVFHLRHRLAKTLIHIKTLSIRRNVSTSIMTAFTSPDSSVTSDLAISISNPFKEEAYLFTADAQRSIWMILRL